ncbi:hypothetical protein S245_049173, partial [Arachis hypogaea]
MAVNRQRGWRLADFYMTPTRGFACCCSSSQRRPSPRDGQFGDGRMDDGKEHRRSTGYGLVRVSQCRFKWGRER